MYAIYAAKERHKATTPNCVPQRKRARHIPPQTDPTVGCLLLRYIACDVCNWISTSEDRNTPPQKWHFMMFLRRYIAVFLYVCYLCSKGTPQGTTPNGALQGIGRRWVVIQLNLGIDCLFIYVEEKICYNKSNQ